MSGRSGFGSDGGILSGQYKIQVARGKLPGTNRLVLPGKSELLPLSAAFTTIWDGNPSIGEWVAPTTDRIHDIVSTSALDTVAGTGARTLVISGTSGGLFTQEIITMNGVTPVPTVNAYDCIHNMLMIAAGTTLQNQGDISAVAQTDLTTTALMLTNRNVTFGAVFKTPSNEDFIIDNAIASIRRGGGTGSAEFSIFFMPDASRIETPTIPISASEVGSTTIQIDPGFPFPVPPDTYIMLKVAPDVNMANVSGNIIGVRIDIDQN